LALTDRSLTFVATISVVIVSNITMSSNSTRRIMIFE